MNTNKRTAKRGKARQESGHHHRTKDRHTPKKANNHAKKKKKNPLNLVSAAEPGLAPVHPVQRPRPTSDCLAHAGVDVDLSVDLVILARLGNLGPGSGKPRATGAVGDPAACTDFTKPAHVFRRGLGGVRGGGLGVAGFVVLCTSSTTVGEVRIR